MANKVSLEVVNFDQELKRIEKEIAELGEISLHQQMNKAVDELRTVTPVDTGEARSGWQQKKERLRTLSGFLEDVGTIQNPVEHIEFLNRGSSKQAPKYFIEQVLAKIGLITPN